jgi:hypothetical protein
VIAVSSLAAALLIAPTVSADTYVSGTITSNTVWGVDGIPPDDSRYILPDDVTVAPGVTLRILPNTTVLFDAGVTLYVEGSLYADGNADDPIVFGENDTASVQPPRGIEFRPSGVGSVSYSTFNRFYAAVTAIQSNPTIQYNKVVSALIGFNLEQSSSFVYGNTIQRAAIGILVNASSDAYVGANTVNGTDVGIEILTSGSPTIAGNAITNVTSSFSVGIRAGAGTSPAIVGNWIYRVRGINGGTPLSPGANGTNGGLAFGIFLNAATYARVDSNWIDTILGGDGGDGAANSGGVGGRGGDGGPGVGVVSIDVPSLDLVTNTITNLVGGRGGRGGQGGAPVTLVGGDGGDGGDVAGAVIVNATAYATLWTNWAQSVTAGLGGTGGLGDSSGSDGDGGAGGDAFGLFVGNAPDADLSGNTVIGVLGGFAGNSTGGAGRGAGGKGGDAIALLAFPTGSSSLFHSNLVSDIRGGQGGRGVTGGPGGDASGAVGFGLLDGVFDDTTLSSNWFEFITGGEGGAGGRGGGNGGLAAGISMLQVRVASAGNTVTMIRGGDGGDAGASFSGGAGGDATGFAVVLVPEAVSDLDTVNGITKGAPGSPAPSTTTYGRGYYAGGNTTIRTSLTVENGTLTSIGDLDIAIEDYANGTTIATSFDGSRISIGSAGNLTVMNYLQVDVFWPDGTTLVAGATILVADNGVPVWNAPSPTGSQSWILATDRVYINSNLATDNVTDVTVSYLAYSFQNNPRSVDLAAAAMESFVMVDTDAPSSTAGALPTYTTTLTFDISYVASDGAGVGLRDITLWSRKDGGSWTSYGTQPAGNSGTFLFTASGDGTYAFATVAEDSAGNVELLPAGNDTWTVVDTTRPASRVAGLPTYQTTAAFLVTWGPEPGVTDIARYTVQYNRGAGWVDWLIGVTATSATFTANPAYGVYEFRSIATDSAGNVEVVSGNDTWTFVDTEPPSSRVFPLTTYQTSLTFTVSWGPVFDSADIASYRIEVNDNGGGWSVWLASTDATGSSFTGLDGHRYEFRSIATDFAGNVEPSPSGNDTWTVVDVTPPESAVSSLPVYSTTLVLSLSWGPVAGTADIATYTIEVSDNGGSWAPISAYVGTSSTSGSFTGVDGHRYAFRSRATDAAGNVEAVSGNDTWTLVDATAPFATAGAPQGSGTNTTPSVSITFSESMDRDSVERAFSISPDVAGQFTWSPDSRILTFTPDQSLENGRDYRVTVDAGAHDLAGNSMAVAYTFTFTTSAAAPPIGGFNFADAWWVLLVIGAAAGAVFFVVRRRQQAVTGTAPKPAAPPAKDQGEAIIEDVFLLYHRDGILIKHETRRLRPEVDSDILSGMLTAVQQFVKDALRGDDYAELNEMKVGHMHILIGRGKWLVLAARIEGEGTASWTQQIERCIKDMEDHHWDQLEEWDGDMNLSRVLAPYVKKLIRGEYG